MTRAAAVVMGLCFHFVIAVTAAPADVQPPERFEALFNGEDLAGWHGMPHTDLQKFAALPEAEKQQELDKFWKETVAHWHVENGEIVNDGKGPYLTTDREFGDIELLIEYRTVPRADSGIYLRGTPQVQIWDWTEAGGKWDRGADKGSGGLYNNPRGSAGRDPLVRADKPFGQWNRFRIIQVGERTSVWLNDRLVVDHVPLDNFWNRDQPLPRRGPIQLQTHGGEIRWRNLFIREIPAHEANLILAAHDDDGFESIFNGRDLTGWKGAIENYEVRDGAIVCKPRGGGNIFTEETYGDFKVRLEFRLPPGGNNGLAIRYPGHGDAAYEGMTELQVLDSDHPRYRGRIDPRQAHGSAYGMIPAATGYLRPAGQWNFQDVTVIGSRITVELNGTVILDGDLSQVKEFMNDRPHPGLKLTSGHFGFAGHNSPVRFRNIRIKRLEPSPAETSKQSASTDS